MQKMSAPEEPQLLVCNLRAMTQEQRQRHKQIAEQLRSAAGQVTELPDGYAVQYAADPTLFVAAAEFITLESRCCPFYLFTLEQQPDKGGMCLRVTGPPETKSFIRPALVP